MLNYFHFKFVLGTLLKVLQMGCFRISVLSGISEILIEFMSYRAHFHDSKWNPEC